MEINMVNTTITLSFVSSPLLSTDIQKSTLLSTDGRRKLVERYNTEFIVQADANTTFNQINALLTSFSKLEDTNSCKEYTINRIIMRDKTKRTGTFIVKLSLADEIKFDEFICKTDDFENFTWYARKINNKEIEEFKPIK